MTNSTESATGEAPLRYQAAGREYAGVLLTGATRPGATAADVTGDVTAAVVLLPDWRGQSALARAHAAPLVARGCAVAVVGAVAEELDAAGAEFRVELYGGARHGFDSPEAGRDPAARLMYSPGAARRAQRAIAEFVAEFVAEVGRGAPR